MASLSSWRDRNTPRLRRFWVSFAKKPSTALSQEADVGVKWKIEARMPLRAIAAPWGACGWHNCRRSACTLSTLGTRWLDGIEEADELLMAMALHALADDGAVEHVERREQRRGAVTLVVMRHRPGSGPSSSAAPAGCGPGPGFGSHGDLRVKMFRSRLHRKFPFVARYPRSEPVCMTRPVSDAASNSHPVAALNGRTNIPLASGEGSGGRDHSLLRLF